MFLIKPCCTQKNAAQLRDKIGKDGTTLCHGYGDLSLAELLPALMTRYSDTELMIVAPQIPDAAAKAIKKVMESTWDSKDGRHAVDTVRRLTLITNLRKNKSPMASTWLKESPWGDRLLLKNVSQNDTAILLPDFALIGPLNLSYSGHFTALATTHKTAVDALRETFIKL
jgi:hypothetical protein